MRGRTGLGGLAMAMTIGMTPMPAAALDTVEAKPLTLERLFAYPSLDGASLRAVRPSPDGRLVAYLNSRDDDAKRDRQSVVLGTSVSVGVAPGGLRIITIKETKS